MDFLKWLFTSAVLAISGILGVHQATPVIPRVPTNPATAVVEQRISNQLQHRNDITTAQASDIISKTPKASNTLEAPPSFNNAAKSSSDGENDDQRYSFVDLEQLMKTNISLKCISHITPKALVTIYISNGMLFSKSESNFNDTIQHGYTIVRDGASYTWSDYDRTGLKVLSSNDNKNNDTLKIYSCHDWVPNSSFFLIPKDIQFSEANLRWSH